MRAHVIENGVVINTIIVDSLDVLPDLIEATKGKIGDLYDGSKFTTPPPKVEAKSIVVEGALTDAEKTRLIDFLQASSIITAARATKLKTL